jgi:hypothetical protein
VAILSLLLASGQPAKVKVESKVTARVKLLLGFCKGRQNPTDPDAMTKTPQLQFN